MAKGEKTFSTLGREVRRYTSEPFPAGDYQLKILGDTFEIRKAETKVDKDGNEVPTFSYINGAFEVLGTGEDGKRNRRVYHNFFLRQKPGKDGSVMSDRADQIVGLARGLGVEIEGISMVQQNGEDIIGPKSLLKWLQSQDGAVVDAHIKVARGRKDAQGNMYQDRNEIEYFIEKEGGSSGPGSDDDEEFEDEEGEEVEQDEAEEDEEDDETTEEEDEEDDDDEDDDEEPASRRKPAKAPVKKAAAKKRGRR